MRSETYIYTQNTQYGHDYRLYGTITQLELGGKNYLSEFMFLSDPFTNY